MVYYGLERTKPGIVERELRIHKGDTMRRDDLYNMVRLTKENLMNTALFVRVEPKIYLMGNNRAQVYFLLEERWYLFPFPYFKVVDRNWNVWLKEHKGSLSRTNIGVKLSHENLRGYNDKLHLWAYGGYTQQLELRYVQPFADKKMEFGYEAGLFYARQKEVNYATQGLKPQFIRMQDGFALNTFHLHGAVSYRPGSRFRSQLRLAVNRDSYDTSLAKLNPNFLGGGQVAATYFDTRLSAEYYEVDYIPFPLRGWYTTASLSQRIGGRGYLNRFQLEARYLRSWPLGSKFYLTTQAIGLLRFPRQQPYFNNQLLGYDDLYLNGMEYYVAEGNAALIGKLVLRREIFNFSINGIPIKNHRSIPFRIYARGFGNMGYAAQKPEWANRLNNRMLFTGGLGIDVVTIYDWVLKIDFSFNQFDSGGKFFIHTQTDF